MESGKQSNVPTRRLTNEHTDAYGDATLIRTGGVTDALNRLKAYEDTGLSPEEIQEVVDLFEKERKVSHAEVPAEVKRWMERCAWRVRKVTEQDKEIERLKASLSAYQNAAESGRRIMRGRVDMKPIIFSAPMVRAILDGNKTMTRRVIKGLLPEEIEAMGQRFGYCDNWWKSTSVALNIPCRPGDILWVRETWAEMPYGYVYRADEEEPEGWDCDDRWRPSIHMPRDAARIFLRVKDVRVERLQQISGEDITREGVGKGEFFDTLTDRGAFRELWDSLRKPADIGKYGWDANPWVWVISFERTEANGG